MVAVRAKVWPVARVPVRLLVIWPLVAVVTRLRLPVAPFRPVVLWVVQVWGGRSQVPLTVPCGPVTVRVWASA